MRHASGFCNGKRYIPVWLAIDIWRVPVLHCKSHFHYDRRPQFLRLRYRCQVIHFSINTNRPNCREPFRRYRVAFLLFAMHFHWISLSMHNLFANCYLLWKQTKQNLYSLLHTQTKLNNFVDWNCWENDSRWINKLRKVCLAKWLWKKWMEKKTEILQKLTDCKRMDYFLFLLGWLKWQVQFISMKFNDCKLVLRNFQWAQATECFILNENRLGHWHMLLARALCVRLTKNLHNWYFFSTLKQKALLQFSIKIIVWISFDDTI